MVRSGGLTRDTGFMPRLGFLLPAAALLLPAGLIAQLQAQDGAVFRSDSRLVVLHATVLDESGRPVTDLPRSAFQVSENGVQQELKVFRREDAPVSMGLIIDDSGSMISKRQRVAAAGLALIEQSHPGDEVFVAHFNEKTFLDADFTGDRARLKRGLETFDSRGTTAMRDAIRLAIQHLSRQAKEDKKVLVLVTDGEDNSSRVDRDFVVKLAQQSGVLVYTVGLLTEIDDEKTRQAERELTALARATGGQVFFLQDVSQVDRTAGEIAHLIRNQYTLAYTPTDEQLDGTYRRIEVAVTAPRPVQVLTRSGYYAIAAATAKAEAPATR